jgi:hypothetical protein
MPSFQFPARSSDSLNSLSKPRNPDSFLHSTTVYIIFLTPISFLFPSASILWMGLILNFFWKSHILTFFKFSLEPGYTSLNPTSTYLWSPSPLQLLLINYNVQTKPQNEGLKTTSVRSDTQNAHCSLVLPDITVFEQLINRTTALRCIQPWSLVDSSEQTAVCVWKCGRQFS